MQKEHQSEREKNIEKSKNEEKGLNLAEENKTELDIDEGGKKRSSKRKKEKKALREASPACDYERIRAANIAERMELLRTLDIEGAVAGAKEGFL